MGTNERGRRNCVSNHSNRLILSLPLDIFFEVLVRVPAEDVVQLKRVCKPWYNLISSRDFTRAHLLHWESKPEILVKQTEDYASLDIRTMEYHQLSLQSYLKETPTVVDSLDGLILFRASFRKELYVCNPITRRLKFVFRIPILWSCQRVYYKLVFDSLLQKYKVVGFYKWGDRQCINMYSILTLEGDEEGTTPTGRDLKIPVLKELGTPLLHSIQGEFAPVAINGVLYWIARTHEKGKREVVFIQSMNIVEEEFKGRIQLPCQPKISHCSSLKLLEMEDMKGSLFVAIPVSHAELGIWVLQDWDKHVWIKKHKISLNLMWPSGPIYVRSSIFVTDTHNLDLMKILVVLVDTDEVLHSYNPKSQQFTKITSYSPRFIYVRSLVSWD